MRKAFAVTTGVMLAIAVFAYAANILLNIRETSGDPSNRP